MSIPYDKIARLQDSLAEIRAVAGYSAEKLAIALDVTRQTIVNLESHKVQMTMMYYLAIRRTLVEIAKEMETDVLLYAICFLVDNDYVSDADRQQLKNEINTIVKRVGHRRGARQASAEIIRTLGPTLEQFPFVRNYQFEGGIY